MPATQINLPAPYEDHFQPLMFRVSSKSDPKGVDLLSRLYRTPPGTAPSTHSELPPNTLPGPARRCSHSACCRLGPLPLTTTPARCTGPDNANAIRLGKMTSCKRADDAGGAIPAFKG